MGQGDGLPCIVQFSSVNPTHRNTWIFCGKCGRVPCEDKKLARTKNGSICEGESDPLREHKPGEVQGLWSTVPQFDELKLLAIGDADRRRVEHHFAQTQSAQILRRIKGSLHKGAPLPLDQHTRAHLRGGVEHQGLGPGTRTRRNRTTAGHPWVGTIQGQKHGATGI